MRRDLRIRQDVVANNFREACSFPAPTGSSRDRSTTSRYGRFDSGRPPRFDAPMSPRIIQLPVSGRDRRFYLDQLKQAERAHTALVERTVAAFREAHDLACQEWNTRQFIGGPAEPSPVIEACILAGRDLLEVRCKRCGHGSMVDLTEVIWPREKQVHTLTQALRCQRCKDERRKMQPDLVALHRREKPDPVAPARQMSKP